MFCAPPFPNPCCLRFLFLGVTLPVPPWVGRKPPGTPGVAEDVQQQRTHTLLGAGTSTSSWGRWQEPLKPLSCAHGHGQEGGLALSPVAAHARVPRSTRVPTF